jgi:hypothetical protein
MPVKRNITLYIAIGIIRGVLERNTRGYGGTSVFTIKIRDIS